MQIIRKGDVLSLINETANDFKYKNISEDNDNPERQEVTKRKDKGGLWTRQAKHTAFVTNPKTGEKEPVKPDITHELPYREYQIGGIDTTLLTNAIIERNAAYAKGRYKNYERFDVLTKFELDKIPEKDEKYFYIFGINKADDISLVESNVVYKMREKFRKRLQSGMNMEDAAKATFDDYNIPPSRVNKELYNLLTASEVVKGSIAMTSKPAEPGDLPFARVTNPTREPGKEMLYVPLDCREVSEFKEKYKNELIRLMKKTGLNPIFIACKGDKKIEGEFQGEGPLDVRGRLSGPSLFELVRKNLGLTGTFSLPPNASPKDVRDVNAYRASAVKLIEKYIEGIKKEIADGADPVEILRERGLYVEPDYSGDYYKGSSEKIGSELQGLIDELDNIIISAKRKTGARASLSETLKTKTNRVLRASFGELPRDAASSKGIQFNTDIARRAKKIFEEKKLPPIIISSKYMDRNIEQGNDLIEMKGLSYNYYKSVYEFLEKIANVTDKEYNTYYLAQQFNKTGGNWRPDVAAVKYDRGETPIYNLRRASLRGDEDFKVVVRLDWSIKGERIGNDFEWTFNIGVRLGKRNENQYEIIGGLKQLPMSDKNYFNKNLVTKTTAKLGRKVKAYSQTTDDRTVIDDPQVFSKLKKVISDMLDKLETEFNPETKLADFADVGLSDVSEKNLQENRELITKYLINKIIQEIKNPR